MDTSHSQRDQKVQLAALPTSQGEQLEARGRASSFNSDTGADSAQSCAQCHLDGGSGVRWVGRTQGHSGLRGKTPNSVTAAKSRELQAAPGHASPCLPTQGAVVWPGCPQEGPPVHLWLSPRDGEGGDTLLRLLGAWWSPTHGGAAASGNGDGGWAALPP